MEKISAKGDISLEGNGRKIDADPSAESIMRDFDANVAASNVLADIMDLSDAGEFPMTGFHSSLIDMVDKLCHWHPTPKDYWMAPILASISAVVGNTVTTSINKYNNTLADWFYVVGDSGENKSLPQKEILKPVYDISERMFDESEKKNREERKGKPNNEYVHLPDKQLVTGRTTLASMEQLLDDNPQGILQHNDEVLSAFEGRNSNDPFPVSRMIEFWNGYTAPTNLVGRGRVKNKDPYHVWLAGIQPFDMAPIVNQGYYTRGFTPRILMFQPQVNVDINNDSTTNTEKEGIIQFWTSKIEKLHRTDSARKLIGNDTVDAFARHVEIAVHTHKHKVDRVQAAVLKKMPQHTHKLAGIVHILNSMFSGDYSDTITIDEIRLAWNIARYSAAIHYNLLAKYAVTVSDGINKNRVIEIMLRAFPEASHSQIASIAGTTPNNISQIKRRMAKFKV